MLKTNITQEHMHLLFNLLALIHRDGGHYVDKHGLTKAAIDAGKVVMKLRQAKEKTQ